MKRAVSQPGARLRKLAATLRGALLGALLGAGVLVASSSCEPRPEPETPAPPPPVCSITAARDRVADRAAFRAAEREVCARACDRGEAPACLARALMQTVEDPPRHLEAARTFGVLCSAGYLPACTPLATAVATGHGALVDRRRAESVLEATCAADEPSACVTLAAWHAEGFVVPRDPGRAAALAARWCERADPFACAALGALYVRGVGVEQDDARAAALLEGACTLGVGCSDLAALELAPGPRQNREAGAALGRQLCDLGYLRACRLVAVFDLGAAGSAEARGILPATVGTCRAGEAAGCARVERALPLLKRACDGGDAESCELLRRDEAGSVALYERGCAAGGWHDCWIGATHALASGPDAAALARLLAVCEAGYARACTSLGAWHLNHGDLAEAVPRFDRGCELGDARGCALEALALDERGRATGAAATEREGTSGAYARAAELGRRACMGGAADGCAFVASLHYEERGPFTDFELAARLFEDGCDHGLAASCLGLGNLHYFGRLGSRDPARALALYTRACDGGHPTACNNAGYLRSLGQPSAEERAASAAMLQKACDGGANLGCMNLANVPGQLATAAAALAGHCDARDLEACTDLGLLRAEHPEAGDPATVRALFATACGGGERDGCAYLGMFRLEGLLGPVDERGAAEPLLRACGAGHASACAALGRMAAEGRGMPGDAGRAGRLYERACDGGAPEGCTLLALARERSGDFPGAASLFADTCRAGFGAACRERGRMLLAGLGGPADPAAASEAYEQAAALGDERAARRLYQLQSDGWLSLVRLRADLERTCDADVPNHAACNSLGVLLAESPAPADRALAPARYQKACEAGVPRACKNLGVTVLCGGGGAAPAKLTTATADRVRARALFERACRPPVRAEPARGLLMLAASGTPLTYEPVESACTLVQALDLPPRELERARPCDGQ
ncbi:MAG: sel1 repeat family protein [Polyangiaceae bacterium]|nr:sel1 repeat family protein [Polyangiaceae bacterium]